MPAEEVCGFEAFLDCLNDPDFDGQLLMELEEFFEIPVHDLDEWMLP
ncbi:MULTISPECIES: hypothetical protein [Streptomyces]|nr:hypothetical protein [Streptomyces cinnamoneus]